MDPFIDFLNFQNTEHARIISQIFSNPDKIFNFDSNCGKCDNMLEWDGYVPPCEYPDDLETIDDEECINIDPGQITLEEEVDDGL